MEMKEVKGLIQRIKLDFSNQENQRRTGDRYFENVPDSIWKLWYSDFEGSLAISNVDYKYIEAKCGIISMDDLYAKLRNLCDAFTREFWELDKANLQEGGTQK